MPDSQSIPTGRDAVATALLNAAAQEFAERGFHAASVRAIAQRAHVNHGLVHRHFGSKSQLLDAVIREFAPRAARDLGRQSRAEAARAQDTALLFRVLTRALLDGVEIGNQAKHPVMDWAIGQAVARTGAEPTDVRVGVTHAVALHLGWLLFGPFLTSSAELSDAEIAHARGGIEAAQRCLIDRELSASGSDDDDSPQDDNPSG